MFATSPSQFPSRYAAARTGSLLNHRLAGLAGSLVRGWRRHQTLMVWNRNLPRPPGCGWVPDRVWRRHSAFLAMQGGKNGKAAP